MNEAYLKRTYGITISEWLAIWEVQGRVCAACKRPLLYGAHKGLRAEVDHDHKVRERRASVRGLLCGGRYAGCNRKLGRVDNVQWLKNMAEYLSNPPAQQVLRKNGKP